LSAPALALRCFSFCTRRPFAHSSIRCPPQSPCPPSTLAFGNLLRSGSTPCHSVTDRPTNQPTEPPCRHDPQAKCTYLGATVSPIVASSYHPCRAPVSLLRTCAHTSVYHITT
jgi:hypothetical protein